MSSNKVKTYVNRQPKYTDEYTIEFRFQARGWFEIHALKRPHDPVRNKNEAHVALDGTLVCVTPGKEPRTLERAEAIAHAWMLGFSEYIRTGRYPKGTRRVQV